MATSKAGGDWRLLCADLIMALGFTGLLVSIAFRRAGRVPMDVVHRRLADFSYSLYLAHYPIIILVVAGAQAFIGFTPRGPLAWAPLLAFFVATPVAVAVAYGMYLAFERRTGDLYRALRVGLHLGPIVTERPDPTLG